MNHNHSLPPIEDQQSLNYFGTSYNRTSKTNVNTLNQSSLDAQHLDNLMKGLESSKFTQFLKQTSNLKLVASQIASLYLQNKNNPEKIFGASQTQENKKLQNQRSHSTAIIERPQRFKLPERKTVKKTENEEQKKSENKEKRIEKSEIKLPKMISQPPQKDQKQKDYFVIIHFVQLYFPQYYLGSGNNSELIKRVLNSRQEWNQMKDASSVFVNFKWQQGQRGYRYDNLSNQNIKQMVNHFEYHRELSNKQYLLRNMTTYCEYQKLNVFDYLPITFVLDCSDELVDYSITQFINFFTGNCPNVQSIQMDQVMKNINEIKKKINVNSLFYLYHIKIPTKQSQKQVAYRFSKPKLDKIYLSPQQSYLWLLKPTFLNRGRGIHVINDIQKLTQLIMDYQQGFLEKDGTTIKANSFVIQKYIERPFLINNRKFDIRVWVLVSQNLDCYFFSEGYIRTSSEIYQVDDIDNEFIHLTNNAIQKFSTTYGQFESGNQISFDEFEDYLRIMGQKTMLRPNLINKMKDIVWMSLASVRKKLNLHDRKYCMEIFGYDFIMDEDLNLWLIEVNTNPCLEESSNILEVLLPRMIDDAFKLTLDTIFQIKSDQSEYPVKNYSSSQNMWQQLYIQQTIQRDFLGNLNSSSIIGSHKRFQNKNQ